MTTPKEVRIAAVAAMTCLCLLTGSVTFLATDDIFMSVVVVGSVLLSFFIGYIAADLLRLLDK